MEKLCLGCMRMKQNAPICELCGFDERMENQPHQLPIGTILQNQYLVGRVLGQGGFGITYIGWDQHLSIPVAIKEYYPGGVVQRNTRWSTDVMCANGEAPELFEKHKTRFLKEARTLAQLSGIPEIVQIKSFFPENGTAYIVMEYVEGITLKDHLKRLGRPMTEGEALTIMEPVLKALQKVHDHGLIHRDISPDNIMLPSGGGVKLIDFGTVRYMDDSGKSKSTEAVLKPGFAPMEQYNTRGNLGTWTDVYAVSATFHYLLTGKVPADVHDRLDDGEELTLLRSRQGISGKLIEAMEMGMKIRAQERIQTISELHKLLYAKVTRQNPQKESLEPKMSVKPSAKNSIGKIIAVVLTIAAVIVIATLLLLVKKPRTGIQYSGPVITERTAPVAIVQDSTPTDTPETTEPITPESIAYAEAEQLLAEGKTAQAAIAFGKLGNYRDAHKRSWELWSECAVRETLSAGEHHTVGLCRDGTVVAVGSHHDDRCDTGNWQDIIAVKAGSFHTVGLRSNGTVVAVGNRGEGRCNTNQWENIVSVDAGKYHTIGLRMDGTVVAVGYNENGQCNTDNWEDIVAVCGGGWHTVGLRSDGTVVAVGENGYGQCDTDSWSDIVAISAGSYHTVGLRSDGTVVAVGTDITENYDESRCDTDNWSDIIAISAGASHTVGLRSDGTVVAVGPDKYNQCDTDEWSDIIAITTKGWHTIGLHKDGSIIAIGFNESGQCDITHWTNIKLPS